MNKYDENDQFFRIDLLIAIRTNIFNKGLKKASIVSLISSIAFLIMLIMSIIFNPSIIDETIKKIEFITPNEISKNDSYQKIIKFNNRNNVL